MIRLALATGIAPSVWVSEGDRAIETALTLLDEQNKKQQNTSKSGRQLSG